MRWVSVVATQAVLVAGGLLVYHLYLHSMTPDVLMPYKRNDKPEDIEAKFDGGKLLLRGADESRWEALRTRVAALEQSRSTPTDDARHTPTPDGALDERLLHSLSLHLDEVQRRRTTARFRAALDEYLRRIAPHVNGQSRAAVLAVTLHMQQRVRMTSQDLAERGDESGNLRHARFEALRNEFRDALESAVGAEDAERLHRALSARISLHTIRRAAPRDEDEG